MSDRCQDGVLDGDQGLEFAYASGQAAVAGAEEGGVLGAVGGHRRDTEGAGEPVVAASDWLSPGATPAQESRCPRVGSDSCWRRFVMITSATSRPTKPPRPWWRV